MWMALSVNELFEQGLILQIFMKMIDDCFQSYAQKTQCDSHCLWWRFGWLNMKASLRSQLESIQEKSIFSPECINSGWQCKREEQENKRVCWKEKIVELIVWNCVALNSLFQFSCWFEDVILIDLQNEATIHCKLSYVMCCSEFWSFGNKLFTIILRSGLSMFFNYHRIIQCLRLEETLKII